ncbi:MAG: hypothetical protein ACOCTG_02290 [Bacteroidota bacterium]
MTTKQAKLALMSSLIFSISLLVMPARAQTAGVAENSVSLSETVDDISLPADDVLADFTRKQWKELRNQQYAALCSYDDRVWPFALRNIIYLESAYGNHVDFRCSCPLLLRMYTTSRWQRDRLFALSAMHAIGDHRTMETLAALVESELDPLIKHVTVAALNDFYRLRKPGTSQ